VETEASGIVIRYSKGISVRRSRRNSDAYSAKANELYDILNSYLVIDFVPKGQMDEKYLGSFDHLIGQITCLNGVDDLRKRILVETRKFQTAGAATIAR
jgi:hypothetical protein